MNMFNKDKADQAAVQTSATSSVNAIAKQLTGDDSIPEAVTSGYLSYGISSVTVDGKVYPGIETEHGFLYPASLGEEVMTELKSFADRGFAYELGADS